MLRSGFYQTCLSLHAVNCMILFCSSLYGCIYSTEACILLQIKLEQDNSLHCSDCHLTLIDTVQVRYNIESYFGNLKRKRFFKLKYSTTLLTLLASRNSCHYLSAKLSTSNILLWNKPSLGTVTIFSRFYTWEVYYYFLLYYAIQARKLPECDSVV